MARASLEEVLVDYRDFLRLNKFEEWEKDHPYALRLSELNKTSHANYETFRRGIENSDPTICANVIIGLIKVTTYLLDKQIKKLEEDFLNHGGIRERMTKARLIARANQGQKK